MCRCKRSPPPATATGIMVRPAEPMPNLEKYASFPPPGCSLNPPCSIARNFFYRCNHAHAKRPLPITPGANHVDNHAGNQDHESVTNLSQGVRTINEYKHESHRSDE